MYVNRRPASPKGQLFAVYQAKGEAAALQHGREVGHKDGKLKRWMQEFATAKISLAPIKGATTKKAKPTTKQRSDVELPPAA